MSFRSEFQRRMCEQIRMIDVPKVSSQESVEVFKKLSFGSKFSERMCEQISGQESRVTRNCPSQPISERMSEQIGVLAVPKILSQDSVCRGSRNCRSGVNF